MVFSAFGFNHIAAFMPLVVGIPVLILSFIDVVKEVKRANLESKQNKESETSGSLKDWFKLNNNEFRIWLWFTSFILGIILTGILFAGALFMFFFITFEAKQKWWVSLLITVSLVMAVYLFFDTALGLTFYRGIFF